jgi:hypothetical protein
MEQDYTQNALNLLSSNINGGIFNYLIEFFNRFTKSNKKLLKKSYKISIYLTIFS